MNAHNRSIRFVPAVSVSIAVVLLVALSVSPARAAIIGWSCAGDDAFTVGSTAWSPAPPDSYYLQVNATQHAEPAHLSGTFTADDAQASSTVWMVQSLTNQTGSAWPEYHIDIGLDKAFSIVGVIAPMDWTWSIVPPTAGQPLPAGGGGTGWLGTVNYNSGAPVQNGQSGAFGIVFSFQGGASFSTRQVPEPAALAGLAGLAGLAAVVALATAPPSALCLRRDRRARPRGCASTDSGGT